MDWARNAERWVVTHDLDFGAILALTHATGPSVVQLRSQDVLPAALAGRLIGVLRAHSDELHRGALLTLDDVNARVRILPLRLLRRD